MPRGTHRPGRLTARPSGRDEDVRASRVDRVSHEQRIAEHARRVARELAEQGDPLPAVPRKGRTAKRIPLPKGELQLTLW